MLDVLEKGIYAVLVLLVGVFVGLTIGLTGLSRSTHTIACTRTVVSTQAYYNDCITITK